MSTDWVRVFADVCENKCTMGPKTVRITQQQQQILPTISVWARYIQKFCPAAKVQTFCRHCATDIHVINGSFVGFHQHFKSCNRDTGTELHGTVPSNPTTTYSFLTVVLPRR
jgi:hypothetical protein